MLGVLEEVNENEGVVEVDETIEGDEKISVPEDE